MDEDLGLSERDKELKRWNRPYRYQEFPRMLFRGTTTTGGRLEVEQRIVGTASEREAAEAHGWLDHPTAAIDAETHRQELPGIAAAERAYRDRTLSARAQAEAHAADAATGAHLGEIRATPKRPRGRPFVKKSTPQEAP